MHICPKRPPPIELTVQGKRYLVRPVMPPEFHRHEIIAEHVLQDGRSAGYHIMAAAYDESDLVELWSCGWTMERRHSGWPVACAITAMGPE